MTDYFVHCGILQRGNSLCANSTGSDKACFTGPEAMYTTTRTRTHAHTYIYTYTQHTTHKLRRAPPRPTETLVPKARVL